MGRGERQQYVDELSVSLPLLSSEMAAVQEQVPNWT